MTGPARLRTLCAAAVLSLITLAPASAQTHLEARYGGTLVVGLRGEPGTLDPTLSRAFSAVVVYRTICEKLYDLDSKAQVVPQLAAALPVVSKDKLTYTIPLRKGTSSTTGRRSTPQAVVTSLQRT